MLKHQTWHRAPLLLLMLSLVSGLTGCRSTPVAKPTPTPATVPTQAKQPEKVRRPQVAIVTGGDFDGLLTAQSGLQAHLQLTLKLDGAAELKAELTSEDPPLLRTGTWQQSVEGPVTVVLSAENGAPLAQRQRWVLSPNGKDLDAQSFDIPGFDSAPLRLFRREPARSPAGVAFVGSTWVWMGDSIPGNHSKSSGSSEFALQLKDDGWFNFRTDCGEGSGMYEIYGQEIALAALHVIAQHCENADAHDRFLKILADTGRFRMSDDRLFFDMKHEAKTIVFYRQP
jgi:hypothetical protein